MLESQHAAALWAHITSSGLVAHLPKATTALLRRTVLRAVLGTDMSTHRELLGRALLRVAPPAGGGVGVPPGFSRASPDDRLLLGARAGWLGGKGVGRMFGKLAVARGSVV